jgi:hypothetical protein
MSNRRRKMLRNAYANCSEEQIAAYLTFARSIRLTRVIAEHIEVLETLQAEFYLPF